MAKRDEPFVFTRKHLWRLLILIVVIFYLINLIAPGFEPSGSTVKTPVLGIQSTPIPQSWQNYLNNVSTGSAAASINSSLNSLISQLIKYPNEIITDLKKQMLDNIYQQLSQSLGISN